MVIDALVLLGDNRFGSPLYAEQALTLADRHRVDLLVAAPARPPGYRLEPANDALAGSCARADGRIRMLGRVDPLNGASAVAEAERCLDQLGAAGLFLHPGEEVFPIRRAAGVMRVAARRRAPVIVAAGCFAVSEPLQIAEVAEAFPDVPVVMTTGGQMNVSGVSFVEAWTALDRTRNLHVLTNGVYRQDVLERLTGDLDHRRVLYGSFAPVFDMRLERRRVSAARMPPRARAAVEHDNAARLFRL